MRLIWSVVLAAAIAAGCGSPNGEAADPTTTSTVPTSTGPTTTVPTTTVSDPEATEFYVADPEALADFLDTAPDEPFYMVNVIRHRERAVYEDGRETDLTGREADAIYGDFMRTEMLPGIGAEIVWASLIEQDMVGLGDFEQIAIVRYPSPSLFRSMMDDPGFQEMLVHKRAGVEDTITLATSRIDTPAVAALANPPYPASDTDTPFAFLHILDYRDLAEYQPDDADADPTISGSEAVAKYSANASITAVPLGVRPVAWFKVEAVVIGHPGWEEARINLFPSHAAFDALTSDPIWESGIHHRAAGLELTHAFMSSPILIDGLTE